MLERVSAGSRSAGSIPRIRILEDDAFAMLGLDCFEQSTFLLFREGGANPPKSFRRFGLQRSGEQVKAVARSAPRAASGR